MISERAIILDSLQHLIERPDVNVAVDCLADWSNKSKNKNIWAAACLYVTHFVIPSLNGEDCSLKKLPLWVDQVLFHPPLEKITNIDEWLSLFPGTACEGLYEREERFGGYYGTLISDETLKGLKTQNIGLYFSPNGHTGQRNAKNTDRLNACFADFDDRTKEEQLAFIRTLPLKPSIIVESGRGYHTYWMFQSIETNKELWVRIQKAIIGVCKSDKNICNPDRLMRLPWSWHTKTDNKKLTRIFEYTTKRYKMSEVEVAFPPEPIKVFVFSNTRPRDLRVPVITTLLPEQRHDGLKTETARIYAKLVREKAGSAREAMKFWYFHSSKPPKTYWEREADSMCDHYERLEYGSVVSR